MTDESLGQEDAFQPTRLLLVGDALHDISWVSHTVRVAAVLRCEAVVFVGDFGYDRDNFDTRSYLDAIDRCAAEHRVRVFWTDSGEDDYSVLRTKQRDDDGFGEIANNVRWIPRGHRWSWAGVSFASVGGGEDRSVANGSRGLWPEGGLDERDLASLGDAPVDVLFASDAPERVPLPGSRLGHALGDVAAEWARRRLAHRAASLLIPTLVIHGRSARNSYVLKVRNRDALGHAYPRVEGLGPSTTRDGRGWAILDLVGLRLQDGIDVGATVGGMRDERSHRFRDLFVETPA